MKTKPFDLEAAKKGAKVVIRNGTLAKILAHVPEFDDSQKLIVYVEGLNGPICYREDGRRCEHHNTEFDLFLAVETKIVYVNLYRSDTHAGKIYGNEYTEKKIAEEQASFDAIAIAQPIEVEV